MYQMFRAASVFNQPLSFETTRPASQTWAGCSPCAPPHALPPICSRALPCTLLAPPSPAASRLPARTSSRTACPPFDPRQGASAFNQPLSFDTSSVTTMYAMFHVRSFPCPAPNLQSSPPLHAACTAVARRLPPPGPHVVPHRMPSFRLSAVRVGVQPAAELRHLQRHNHARHVLRALLPVHCPEYAVEPSPSRWTAVCAGPHPHPAPHTPLSSLGRTRWRSTSR
eukprot:scaffold67699_cov63-Phaeocystis_antarctica.AAC.1